MKKTVLLLVFIINSFSINSQCVSTFAGSVTFGYADGTGTSAQFSYPDGIAVDGSGNVYVGDLSNHRILKITGPASDGAVKFELTPKYSGSCVEDIWTGTAYLTNSAVANYTLEGSECHFNFTFNTGQIEVNEYDCSHGATCGTFDGFYKK